MPTILVFQNPTTGNRTEFTGTLNRVNKNPNNNFVPFFYEKLSIEMGFGVNGAESSVYFDQEKIEQYDAFYIRNSLKQLEVAKTIVEYLKHKEKPFTDSQIGLSPYGDKLFQTMRLSLNNLPVPKSLYFSKDIRAKSFEITVEKIGLPFIMKDFSANGGELNFLVKNKEEYLEIILANDASEFILQEFIPNKFDYRILVSKNMCFKKRSRLNEKDHRNNVYLGATQEIVEPSLVDISIKNIAQKASQLLGLNHSGVDIVISDKTNQPYILEVNNAPGFSTDEEYLIFTEFYTK